MEKISVIVPVYNVERYIYRCVDSILCQSYCDLELILVDDGSPDGCAAICDQYALQDIRVHVIHQNNGGLSAARNAGIDWVFANSDSQWLTFVDSDDWIHEDFLQILYNAAKENGCLLSACCGYRTSGDAFPVFPEIKLKCVSADDYYCIESDLTTPAPAWGKLYHRTLFNSLRYPVGKLHEDEFTTYLAVYDSGKVAVIPLGLYAYYQNPQSITLSKWNPKRLDVFDGFHEQMKFAQETGNRRLMDRVTDSYVWALALQANQLSAQRWENDSNKKYLDDLRRTLKTVLKDGMNDRYYPLTRKNLLLYEEAYPVKILWHAIHGMYGIVKRLLGK